MKTSSPFPAYHYIDAAPLARRYEVLMASILVLIEAGRMARVLKLSRKVTRVIRLYISLETQNILLARKLDMLLNKPWRDLVLKQLGGMRRLRRWEMAAARHAKAKASRKARPEPKVDPAWLYTPERIAESERLKAHARLCARACISPNVVRDRIRMDFKGEFRLAPLPRGHQAARKMKVYTQASISEYDYNAMPYGEVKNFGPATVWPAEFRAAIAAEAEVTLADDIIPEGPEAQESCAVPTLPLHVAIPLLTYWKIFHPLA